jgi:hypothetical protein
MWQWILLFIVLTPGVLFTIPPYGKKFVKGVSGTVVTAVLHGLLFAAAARFFMLCKEGFQLNEIVQALGDESAVVGGVVPNCPLTQYERPVPTCTSCPAGFSCNGMTRTACSSGTHAVAGAGVCTACPTGQVPNFKKSACQTPSADATGTATGGSRVICNPGTGAIRSGILGGYTWGTTCETCPAGTYSAGSMATPGVTTTRRCAQCPTAKPYSNAGANGFSECRSTP